MAIRTVWIEEGCIQCNACEIECPDVFKVTDNGCVILATVRQDGVESDNRHERSPLKAELQASLEAPLESAASGCPVEVIEFAKA